MYIFVKVSVFSIIIMLILYACKNEGTRHFDSQQDLLSLHYDHAPDKDDGHSAAADRTILETLYGKDWIRLHVVAVSGAYGKNAGQFDAGSDAVMNAAWNECGGWLAAHGGRDSAVQKLTDRWLETIKSDGHIWVKEGGQSDISAEVVAGIRQKRPEIKTTSFIHVVQHSDWNENQTSDGALIYIRKYTDYIRIPDANNYLNIRGGDARFVKDALAHPLFGSTWRAAFDYYDPRERLDFSDTGELMYIIGLGELNIEDFRQRFFH